MNITCHRWIEHLVHPSSVQEKLTEIASLTEANSKDIKGARVYKQDSATLSAPVYKGNDLFGDKVSDLEGIH